MYLAVVLRGMTIGEFDSEAQVEFLDTIAHELDLPSFEEGSVDSEKSVQVRRRYRDGLFCHEPYSDRSISEMWRVDHTFTKK